MDNPMTQTGVLLISTLFGFFILMVMLRFLLQWVKADFYNPFCQFLMKLTNPLLLPLRRIIPGFGGIDLAALILMIVLQVLEITLLSLIQGFPIAHFTGVALLSLGYLLRLLINVYFYGIIIQALMSWFVQHPHPFVALLHRLTDPVLRPARRLIPTISGFDISIIPVLLILQILQIWISSPIIQQGQFLLVTGQ